MSNYEYIAQCFSSYSKHVVTIVLLSQSQEQEQDRVKEPDSLAPKSTGRRAKRNLNYLVLNLLKSAQWQRRDDIS